MPSLRKKGTHEGDDDGVQMLIKCLILEKEEREKQNARVQGKGIS
jgi:hypothetical protein